MSLRVRLEPEARAVKCQVMAPWQNVCSDTSLFLGGGRLRRMSVGHREGEERTGMASTSRPWFQQAALTPNQCPTLTPDSQLPLWHPLESP